MRRIFPLGVAGAAAVGVAFCTVNFMTAESRLRGLCEQISPGMTLEDLQTFARKNDLGTLPKGSGTRYLVESKTFGRFGCRVEVVAGQVRTAAYHFSD